MGRKTRPNSKTRRSGHQWCHTCDRSGLNEEKRSQHNLFINFTHSEHHFNNHFYNNRKVILNNNLRVIV